MLIVPLDSIFPQFLHGEKVAVLWIITFAFFPHSQLIHLGVKKTEWVYKNLFDKTGIAFGMHVIMKQKSKSI